MLFFIKFNFKAYHLKCKLLLLALITSIFLVPSVRANTIIQKIEEVENQLDARIGVSIYDVTDNKLWSYNGDTRFPLMSTFKTLACAKLLVDIEKGLQSFDTSSVITVKEPLIQSP